jgi:hypothetical protein
MGFFSLNWFKSEKQKQLETLKVEEQALKNALLNKKLENAPVSTTCDQTTQWKPYKNVKMVNKSLTIVLNDGSILTKLNATTDDFNNARGAKTEEYLLSLVGDPKIVDERKKVEREYKKVEAIINSFDVLRNLKDFRVDGNSVYLVGIDRSLPQLLVEEFLVIVNRHGANQNALDKNEEFQSLKRFFMWCCLNPRAEVANELYRFLKENSFRITKQGFFVALRNVVTLDNDNELVKFVSNAYNKVKAVWKKSPDNYRVVKLDGEYRLQSVDSPFNNCELIGNLTTLYLDLPNMAGNRFTDDWTKTFDIRLGKVVNMPMEDCNWSTQDCAAAGLHFTADQIHYVGCGDQSVLVLINPMKVVGIGQHKGRCYEYLPIMAVPREEATEILHDLDFDTLELDEDYAIRELDNLAEKVKEGFVAESSKYEFNLPHISTVEINAIVRNLDNMKAELSKRVTVLD